MTLSELALDYAIKEIGKEEIPHGSNWGVNVQKYLATVGITFPASWCMAFVYWCVEQAANELKVPNPLFKSGGVMEVWNHMPTKRLTVANVGAIFIMDFHNGHGHTGFVKNKSPLLTVPKILTVEGNSNENGSADGYEVCSRPQGRFMSTIKGYIHLD